MSIKLGDSPNPLMLQREVSGSFVSPFDKGEPGYNTPRLSVTENEGHILAALVRGRLVLEIGTGLGVSARFMASSAEHVFTCDIDGWVRTFVWPTLADLSNVTPVFMSEPDCYLPDVMMDAVFIDGCHAPEAVWEDIRRASTILRPGGYLIFHDTKYDHVRRVVLRYPGPTAFFDTEHGIGVKWPDAATLSSHSA